MRSQRYLNIILTINAALLGLIVLSNFAAAPALTPAAHASPLPSPQNPPAGGGGIPNAGGQRERMIDELVAIRESIEGLKKTVETGKLKVTIANIDEMKAAAAAAGAAGAKAAEEKGK